MDSQANVLARFLAIMHRMAAIKQENCLMTIRLLLRRIQSGMIQRKFQAARKMISKQEKFKQLIQIGEELDLLEEELNRDEEEMNEQGLELQMLANELRDIFNILARSLKMFLI